MNKFILLALIAVGITLLVLGVNAYKAVDSDIAEVSFTGSATDAPMGVIIGGGVATLLGAGGFMRDPKRKRNS